MGPAIRFGGPSITCMGKPMTFRLLSALVAVVMAFAVASDAFARAGKSGSLGSRGSRTYDRPIERSVTPPPATQPAAPSVAPSQPGVAQPGAAQPMYNPGAVRQPGMAAQPMAPAAQPGFFQRNPVMGGILGGLVGAGIGSMLFGSSSAMAAAADASPMAGMFGTLLQFALIGGLIWLAVRLFRRRSQPAPAHGPAAGYHREATAYAAGPTPAQQRVAKEFEPTGEDQDDFTRIILGVQQAWAEGNPVALRQLATPEVVGWMSEDLSRDQANGVRNVVEDVQLLKGDVTETWHENGRDYATAVITFSSKDYMVRIDTGAVVEGDAKTPVEATEAWTFVRGADRAWRLSAIEQA